MAATQTALEKVSQGFLGFYHALPTRAQKGLQGVFYSIVAAGAAGGAIEAFHSGMCGIVNISGLAVVPYCKGGVPPTLVFSVGMPALAVVSSLKAKQCFKECFF